MFSFIDTPTPFVFQAESSECALACLSMVLARHGRHVELAALREENPGGRALSLQALCRVAEHQGLSCRALRADPEDLGQITLPAIVHWEFDHYVVVEKARRDHLLVLDPAAGRLEISRGRFSQCFTGIVLELTPGPDFRAEPRSSNHSPAGFYRQLTCPGLPAALINVLALSLCVQALAMTLPFFVQIVVDEVVMGRDPDLLVLVTGGFGLLYGLHAIAMWFRNIAAIHIGSQLGYLMGATLKQRLLNLKPEFFARRSVGDITSRFGSLAPLREFIVDIAPGLLLDCLMALCALCVVFVCAPPAGAWLMLMTLLLVLTQYLGYLPYRRHTQEAILIEASQQTHFIESIQGMDSIRRQEVRETRLQQWMNLFCQSLNARIRAARMQVLFDVTRFLMNGLCLLGIVALSVSEVNASAMTLGMLFTLVAFTGHFTNATLSIVRGWQQFLMLSLHVQRLSDITGAAEDRRSFCEPADAVTLQFNALTYAYPGSSNSILDRFSLSISGNEKVAVCGPSGIGKSTLLRLVLCELEPQCGEILLNSRPLSTSLSVYPLCAALLQSDDLITGSVADNICFMSSQPDRARIQEVAALACIHQDILRMPMAYDERIGNGVGCLSAGQCQRILIARALYRQVPLLLLDECTSHLDDFTAQSVMRNILGLPGACLFVTHDEALANLADRIIRLETVGWNSEGIAAS